MNLVLLGPPGAGKGTQAVMLADEYGIPHISTGDILRKSVIEETQLGKAARKYMDRGELVPDEVVIGIVGERLRKEDCKNGFLLDGFPRTIAQTKALQAVLEDEGKNLSAVLYIRVGERELVRRLTGRRTCISCGKIYHIIFNPPEDEKICGECRDEIILRDDDKEESVRRRFEVYMQETQPLINFYKGKGLLREIDGEKSPTEVYRAIKRALEGIG